MSKHDYPDWWYPPLPFANVFKEHLKIKSQMIINSLGEANPIPLWNPEENIDMKDNMMKLVKIEYIPSQTYGDYDQCETDPRLTVVEIDNGYDIANFLANYPNTEREVFDILIKRNQDRLATLGYIHKDNLEEEYKLLQEAKKSDEIAQQELAQKEIKQTVQAFENFLDSIPEDEPLIVSPETIAKVEEVSNRLAKIRALTQGHLNGRITI